MELTVNTSVSKQGEIAYIQKLLNVFVFFLTFPCLAILGNSITFYIFIVIILRLGLFWQRPFKAKAMLFSLMLICILSTALAPYDEMEGFPGFFPVLQLVIQFIYWMLLASFFIIYRAQINWYEIARSAFWGVLLSAIGFFVLDYKASFAIVDFTTTISRNAFVFDVLATTPISCIYILRRYGIQRLYIFLLFTIFIMLLSNGRSGAILILMESALIISIFSPMWNRIIKFSMLPLLGLFFLTESSTFQPVMNATADKIEGLSPRMANLLRNEGDGDLTQDKSWLLRKLMIEKGQEIIKDHTLIGIGINNFIYYQSELSSLYDNERLSYHNKEYMNSRSAHNSYVLILSEMGVLGFAIFIVLLLIPVIKLLKIIFLKNTIKLNHLPIIGLLGISMHFYAVASVYGGVTWFVIGMAIAASEYE